MLERLFSEKNPAEKEYNKWWTDFKNDENNLVYFSAKHWEKLGKKKRMKEVQKALQLAKLEELHKKYPQHMKVKITENIDKYGNPDETEKYFFTKIRKCIDSPSPTRDKWPDMKVVRDESA